MTTSHLKMGVETTHEAWCILNIPHIMDNIEHNYGIMNGPTENCELLNNSLFSF